MKKPFYILALLVVSALFGGCTLSMDEYLMPEEDKGVYEPYTVKTDVVNVTYEYNDGVKPITNNVMAYLATVEADTILYFKDNVPDEWLPAKGGYVQIGCNETFPLGYNGRVLQRSEANGLIRLV